jgi:hypothetical protein
MIVTSALGFLYIWIDALCIIQDSDEDKQSEMSKMGEIYRDSRLTIMAAHGVGVESGLFVRRDPRSRKPCLTSIAIFGPGLEGGLQMAVSLFVELLINITTRSTIAAGFCRKKFYPAVRLFSGMSRCPGDASLLT